MRNLGDIIIDLKEGKTVDYEEARLGCLVFSNLLFFAESNIKQLLESKNPLIRDLIQKDYKQRHFNALKKSPEQWLGNSHPNNPEQKKFMEIGNRILDKVIKENERK